jgi:flagellin-like protein
MKHTQNENAVSPVIGVILMVAIVHCVEALGRLEPSYLQQLWQHSYSEQ